MCLSTSPPTTNPFTVLLGEKALKWDVVWNYLHWLSLPHQGHGLGPGFLDKLTEFAFGRALNEPELKQEFKIAHGKSGKWPDLAVASPNLQAPSSLLVMDDIARARAGESRKIKNLEIYLNGASELVGATGQGRVLALTDTTDLQRFEALRTRLGRSCEGTEGRRAWRILPLVTVGGWVYDLAPKATLSVRADLEAFAEWTELFSHR